MTAYHRTELHGWLSHVAGDTRGWKRDMSLVNVPHRGMLDSLSPGKHQQTYCFAARLCFCRRLGENAPSSNIYAASRFVISPRDIYVGLRARHYDYARNVPPLCKCVCRTRVTHNTVRRTYGRDFLAYDKCIRIKGEKVSTIAVLLRFSRAHLSLYKSWIPFLIRMMDLRKMFRWHWYLSGYCVTQILVAGKTSYLNFL